MRDGFSNIRLHKVCCADSNSAGACEHELDSVLSAHDAAHTDDGDMHSLRHLINQAYCDRTNSGAAEAAGYVAEYRALALNINLGAEQRVNHRNCICACCFHSLRHNDDVRNVRGKLGNNHFAGVGLYCTHNLSRSLRHSTEDNAALLNVRAGNVDFHCVHAVYVELFRHSAVFLRRMAINVDYNRHIILAQLRQSVLQEVFAAGVLQTDAVQHTGRSFDSALALVAGGRLQGGTLDGNSADLFEVEEVREFQAEAKGAGAGSNRRSHFQAGNINCQTAIIQCFYHSPTSSAQNTGPSLQTLMRLPMPSQAQDRHAPRPQAIYFSRDT